MSAAPNPLTELLRQEVARRGPISFREFMEQALYHPEHGYYGSGRARIGRRGDFPLASALAIILMAVSGVVLWWKRRPAGRLGAPFYPRQYRAPLPVIVIALLVCLAFPLTGAAVMFFAVIDFLLPRRFKEAGAT